MPYRILTSLLLFFTIQISLGQTDSTPKFHQYYKSLEGHIIFMPLGKIAFADSLVYFTPGNPSAKSPYNNPVQALGEPDVKKYKTQHPNYISLGCGGQITLSFKKVGFIDIDGPDLVFFEVGPAVEPFQVEISADGKKWLSLGKQKGGQSTVDIGKFIRKTNPPQVYHYIRLTDLKHTCGGPTPGADIDAVGAIGAVIKLNLNAKVLFDSDQYHLKNTALHALDKLVNMLNEIPEAKISISGHTDSDAGTAYNIQLGQNRANSVKKYLQSKVKQEGNYQYQLKSYGKSKPIASNETEEGKRLNRRVEILVFPSEDFYKKPR